MGEGKTGIILIVAVVAVVALAAAGTVYVRSRPATQQAAEVYLGLDEEAAATSSGQDRVADVLNADDYLDEALNDLDAVNF
jgi:flagellar basal body-associated protein FliL